MPTIEFSLKDLNKLVGSNIKVDEVDDLAAHGKGEFEGYDKATDTVTISFGDTNLPYLWSVEGFARLVKGLLGKEKGIPKLDIKKGSNVVKVDKKVEKVRPYISCFIAKGQKIDDFLLKQLIQLQEKLTDSYGRRRRKASIGIYRHEHISFPVTYTTVSPTGIKFPPLEFGMDMTPAQILDEHPTGKKYSFTLDGMKEYPLLIDDKKQVLSLVPIINSNDLGKVSEGDKDVMVEVTGTDKETVDITSAILAYAFADRGFEIESMVMEYGKGKINTPDLKKESIKIKESDVNDLMGLKLKAPEIEKLLEKARYDVKGLHVDIPPYRGDILHPVDVAEDAGIMYGYDKIETVPMTSYTIGDQHPVIKFVDTVREIMVGFEFQEVMSPVLSNKELLYEKMNLEDTGTVEIKEYMSATYSVVRTWLIPTLLDVLSKNKHHEYPQNIFEQGLVTVRKGQEITDYERIGVVHCEQYADYTRIRQVLDAVFAAFDCKGEYKDTEHPSFIGGRVARVSVNGKDVAYIGEIDPAVLHNFEINMPVAAMELNLSELYAALKKN